MTQALLDGPPGDDAPGGDPRGEGADEAPGADLLRPWGDRDPRWTGIRSDAVDVQGTLVHLLRAEGPADGTPHLLVHGLGGSATNWLDVIGPLTRHGPVAAVDLPGFGRTEPPSHQAARLRAQRTFVSALCHALGWDRIVLHGNSMGGLISILVAARHPGLIERLVLIAPGIPTPTSKAHTIPGRTVLRFVPFLVRGVGERTMARMFERLSPEELLAQSLELVYADPDRLRDSYRKVALENYELGQRFTWRTASFATAARSLLGLLIGRGTVYDAVEAIEAPTMVVWGEDDNLVTPAAIDELGRRRPDWLFESLAGVGHAPMVETPDRYLTVVEGWLGQ